MFWKKDKLTIFIEELIDHIKAGNSLNDFTRGVEHDCMFGYAVSCEYKDVTVTSIFDSNEGEYHSFNIELNGVGVKRTSRISRKLHYAFEDYWEQAEENPKNKVLSLLK